MKAFIAALGGAAVLALAALATPAQAQPHPHRPPPHHHRPLPPPRYVHPGYHHGPHYGPPPRHWGPRQRMRDSDRDGVPDRYDRRPYNPYRR